MRTATSWCGEESTCSRGASSSPSTSPRSTDSESPQSCNWKRGAKGAAWVYSCSFVRISSPKKRTLPLRSRCSKPNSGVFVRVRVPGAARLGSREQLGTRNSLRLACAPLSRVPSVLRVVLVAMRVAERALDVFFFFSNLLTVRVSRARSTSALGLVCALLASFW